MTAASEPQRRVFDSSVFGWTAWTAAAFFLAAAALLLTLIWRTNTLLIDQVVGDLREEAAGLSLDFQIEGWARVVENIQRRSGRAGDHLYFVSDGEGRRLAGNLPSLPAGLSDNGEEGGVFEYARRGEGNTVEKRSAVAIAVRFPNQAVAYVGRDIEETEEFARWIKTVFLTAFALLSIAALAASTVVSRLALRRLDSMNKTAQQIMDGDLTQRIPVSGGGDELDDLAASLNEMLDRIEQLMNSLREVSDNIAHDLKTPLNRLRNRAEAALRDSRGDAACRDGLEQTIEEADGLIRTFNALLLIARLEAGAIEKTAETFDLSELARDVGEFYEPVAEEKGLTLQFVSTGIVRLHANKQLVSQAIVNLIDNAIKYGQRGGKEGTSDGAAGGQDMAIRISTQASQSDAEIKVCDRGPGISSEDRKRVLNRFVRLQQSRTEPGTGLGLSLVAAVARMHHGTIELTDNAPGLCVALKLPAGTEK